MHIDLKGRTARVTGSTQGIGAAIAVGFARAGARVGVNGRSRERVEAAVAGMAVEAPGADLVAVAADVATEEGAAEVVDALPQVDILVNKLGTPPPGARYVPMADTSTPSCRDVVSTRAADPGGSWGGAAEVMLELAGRRM